MQAVVGTPNGLGDRHDPQPRRAEPAPVVVCTPKGLGVHPDPRPRRTEPVQGVVEDPIDLEIVMTRSHDVRSQSKR